MKVGSPTHFLFLLALPALLLVTSWPNSVAREKFEDPNPLRASSILSAHLRKGPHHTVQEEVVSNGYFASYTIDSRFGTFDVQGSPLLEVRVGELVALAELEKLTSSRVFADAAYTAGKGIVLAPVNIVKKTAEYVSDPQKMADTLAEVPEGVGRLFSWAYRQAKRGVSAVGNAFSSSESDTSKTSETGQKTDKKTTTDVLSDAGESGESLGLRYIGYTKRQRKWFRALKVNPYTSNETLRSEIIRVATIETAVGISFRFVPGLGLLGELSTINSWYSRAERLSLYEAPDLIRKQNQNELLDLGLSEETIAEFFNNKFYTPWTRRFITASLTAIGTEVKGHDHFLKAASTARSEAATLYYVSIAEALEKYHKEKPLSVIVSSFDLPAGITKDKHLFIPLSVDYLFWTEEISAIFHNFKTKVGRETPFRTMEVSIRGGVSPDSLRALKALGANVHFARAPTDDDQGSASDEVKG
jgi:hypothetical protein